ncbi:small integral membrane protein 22-like [Mus pahari]|uniref:small integral membrane protein 22-like n=1 Tax=Mus pahari TaxID=10093 RepID=UPI000A3042D9|nr:small integral membrane protein 22-like [Mus pahari]
MVAEGKVPNPRRSWAARNHLCSQYIPRLDPAWPLEATAEEVLGRLRSRQLFQSEWDIAAFVVFLISVGTVVLLLLLVVVHCSCCCCCSASPRPRKEKPKGVDNLTLEP